MSLKGVTILYINNFGQPYLGGGEVHLMHLIRASLSAGMDVHLVAARGSGIAEVARAAGARVVEQVFSTASTVARARELRTIARATGASIVQGTGYYTNLLARLAGEGAIVNTIHTMADAPVHQKPGLMSSLSVRARGVVDRLTAGTCVTRVADSHAIAESLRDATPGMRVIYNGVDPAGLAAEASMAKPPAQVARAHGAGRAVVGCVARLEPVKGIGDLIEAAAMIQAEGAAVSVLIAGTGPSAQELARHIQSRPGLENSVELLGFVESAAAFIGGLDVFVLPSHSEGFNTTVLEAMALGIPVVATDAGGTREAVEDRVTGMLVPPRDPQAMAAAITALLAERQTAAMVAERARARVVERFTVERMTGEYLELYAEIIAGKRCT